MKLFYRTEVDFSCSFWRLKLKQCPNPKCRKFGFLIRYGYIYGGTEASHLQKIRRGFRVFCNNRKKRKGCGGTFSVLNPAFIKNFSISANSLFRYLFGIQAGKNKAEAFRDAACGMSRSTPYRIYSKFKRHQVFIRTLLNQESFSPPELPCIKDPIVQTIRHIMAVFKKNACPITQFQLHFQKSIL